MSNKEMSNTEQEILQRRLKERRLFLNMTYQDLADKTGISKSTLQRYENGGIKNLPYDKIYAISSALEVSTNYFTDLSNDYTGEIPIKEGITQVYNREIFLERIKAFEQKSLEKITPSLISKGYALEQRSHGSVGDLVASKSSEVWHIDFLYLRDVNKSPVGSGMQTQQLLLRFGRLSVYNKPITKFSIVMEHRVIAENLVARFNPIHLNIKVSILLLTEKGFDEIYFN